MEAIEDLSALRRHWISGDWRESRSTTTFEVHDPCTEEVIGAVPAGSAEDVDEAVEAAASALPAWRATPLEERLELVGALCDAMEADIDALASIITSEVGAPVAIAGPAHVGLAVGIARSFIDVAAKFPFEEQAGRSTLLHEPVGVVGCITPWNLPLILISQKLPGALAAGCTVVLKPSELTPFSALRLAECTAAAGLPPGVVNVVTGDGPITGESIVTHPKVDKVSFTGSTRAGRRVGSLAAESVKRVSLELGGKSANLVLPDADLERAVRTGVHQATFNAGQSCIAWSRILVHEDQHADATELAAEVMSAMRVGDPRDPATDIGPLVSAAARDRVQGYIRSGIEQGAHVATGGPDPVPGLDRGYYVRPTILSGVSPDMTCAQQEIFGPVVCVIPYRDEAQAVEIANATDYGLHGAVWSSDVDRARRVAAQIRSGMLNINGYDFDPFAPFGGMKQSGVGRELGVEGLSAFLETKVVMICQ